MPKFKKMPKPDASSSSLEWLTVTRKRRAVCRKKRELSDRPHSMPIVWNPSDAEDVQSRPASLRSKVECVSYYKQML